MTEENAAKEKELTQGELEEWIKSTTGIWHYKDAMDGQVKSEAYANLRKMVGRACKRDICEPSGNRDGYYRTKDLELTAMQISKADPKAYLPLHWPFDLQKYAKIYKGNVIVVFGDKSAGKTAFCLNVAKLNMGGFPVVYWNSDMGAEEMRMRVEGFDDISVEDWDELVEMYERNGDFEDVIKPNHINIVDFFEIHDEFFRIGKPIKAMADKLEDGILVIVIQKNKDAELGLGGRRAIEKAKMVIVIDHNKLTLWDAKNWGGLGLKGSPRGKAWTFQLVNGIKFINPIEVVEE